MNDWPGSQSWRGLIQHYTSQVLNPFIGWLPCLQRRRQVHPETGCPADSEFFNKGSDRQIRIVHIEGNKKQGVFRDKDKTNMVCHPEFSVEIVNPQIENSSWKSRSLSMASNSSELSSEDYWFTRWNRPLRSLEPCNCSFRKSWTKSLRDSKFLNHVLPETQEEIIHTNPCDDILQPDKSCVDGVSMKKTTKSSLIENFVEVLIQEILFDTIRSLANGSQPLTQCDNSGEHHFGSFKSIHADKSSRDTIYSHDYHECEIKEELLCSFEDSTIKNIISDIKCETPDGKKINLGVGCVNPSFIDIVTESDLVKFALCTSNESLCDVSSLKEGKKHANKNEIQTKKNYASVSETTLPSFDIEHESSLCQATNNYMSQKRPYELEVFKGNCDNCVQSEVNSNNSYKSTQVTAHLSNNTEAKGLVANHDNQKSKSFATVLASDLVQEINTHVPEPVFQSVNRRKESSTCRHTLNSIRLKPTLFFLHGVGCSAEIWSNLLQHFVQDGYEVVAPDMLGHGYSYAPDQANAYTFRFLLKDALDIFDKFVGEQKKCVVIGHAYGCSLAAAMARYRPLQVSQLVLISGGGPTPLAPRTADSRPPSVSPFLLACMKPLLLCGFRRDILYAPCGKHIGSGDALSSGVPSYVLHHIARGQDWPEGDSAFHRRILVPTLLVHGMQDPYVTLVQECEMERTIPRSFLELIPNAGHFSMLETPTKLSHMIHCFIEWWNY